jgi:SAM-dependent methyltransferase
MSMRQSTRGYAQEAEQLAVRYEAFTFEDLHRDHLHLFPPPPARVLEIGAGTGRDAAALAQRGYQVLAVEPTAELRREGQRLHSDAGFEWFDDGLPELDRVLARRERFDLILLTAVWMHLDEAERQIGMERLRRLVAPSGRIVLSLRHGPVPPGRRMFDVSFDETERLAQSHGLRSIHHVEGQDTQRRPGVWWTWLALSPQG